MKKSLLYSVVVALFVLAIGGILARSVLPADLALASTPGPLVIAVSPAAAPNDIHTPVTIMVSGFTPDASGTPPAVSLVSTLGASTPLTDVDWSGDATITASVPWGMDPGTYNLIVSVNSTSATLYGAYTAVPGIGQWNAGDLFGGQIHQLLMKPGDADTVYALADGVGFFRTTDGGDNWTFINKNFVQNADFVLDPSHPAWLYSYSYAEPEGLYLSSNEGSTWLKLSSPWTVGTGQREVFVSPHTPSTLFLGSYASPDDTFPTVKLGLKKSINSGTSWSDVAGMSGVPVQSVAFDPANASNMVMATSDARVFRSTNGGTTWTQATTPSATVTQLGNRGFITYNPHKPGEVWFVSNGTPDGIFKSTDASLTSWQPVTPVGDHGFYTLSFPATDTVYIPRFVSTNDGDSWDIYGPSPWYGGEALVFAPDTTQTAYIGDDDVGVRKTTDWGQTWPAKNNGLTGLRVASMDVSRADGLRVYGAFSGPLGMYLSGDGTNHWVYHPISDSWNVAQVLEDPFNPAHVYAVTGPGLYATTSSCETWTSLGWNLPPLSPSSDLSLLAVDPFHEGHLLGASITGGWNTGQSWLYSSEDSGTTWQGPITTPQNLRRVTSITFDPQTSGLVYVTTFGTGLFRSTDNGTHWARLDNRTSQMAFLANIAIATHPQRVLMVQSDPGGMIAGASSMRSLNGGSTWQAVTNVYNLQASPSACVFAGNDSTRLYASSPWGLYFSADVGNSWTAAAGALGKVEITGLNWGIADGHTLIYAATNGGTVGGTSAARVGQRAISAATPAQTVGAGIYRRMTRPVTRVAGSDRYVVAANLARKGWDPASTKAWTGVRNVIIACGDPGKEADPLSAAGLAGVYDAPILLVKQLSVPAAATSVITEIAKRNPGLKVHIVGGTGSVPDARFNEIKAIAGVNKIADRLGGADRYAVSVTIAKRMIALKGTAGIPGVLLVCAENPAAFYDALAASPIAYAKHMPMLSVRKATIPSPVKSLLLGSLAGKARYAASSSLYLGASATGAARLTTSSNRYSAASGIAGYAVSPAKAWLGLADVGLASKLPDSLTGGAFMGKRGGVLLFTDSTSTLQVATKSFITSRNSRVGGGWIFGGTASVTTPAQTTFVRLLQ